MMLLQQSNAWIDPNLMDLATPNNKRRKLNHEDIEKTTKKEEAVA